MQHLKIKCYQKHVVSSTHKWPFISIILYYLQVQHSKKRFFDLKYTTSLHPKQLSTQGYAEASNVIKYLGLHIDLSMSNQDYKTWSSMQYTFINIAIQKFEGVSLVFKRWHNMVHATCKPWRLAFVSKLTSTSAFLSFLNLRWIGAIYFVRTFSQQKIRQSGALLGVTHNASNIIRLL